MLRIGKFENSRPGSNFECYRDGWSACEREDVHLEEALQIFELDRAQDEGVQCRRVQADGRKCY